MVRNNKKFGYNDADVLDKDIKRLNRNPGVANRLGLPTAGSAARSVARNQAADTANDQAHAAEMTRLTANTQQSRERFAGLQAQAASPTSTPGMSRLRSARDPKDGLVLDPRNPDDNRANTMLGSQGAGLNVRYASVPGYQGNKVPPSSSLVKTERTPVMNAAQRADQKAYFADRKSKGTRPDGSIKWENIGEWRNRTQNATQQAQQSQAANQQDLAKIKAANPTKESAPQDYTKTEAYTIAQHRHERILAITDSLTKANSTDAIDALTAQLNELTAAPGTTGAAAAQPSATTRAPATPIGADADVIGGAASGVAGLATGIGGRAATATPPGLARPAALSNSPMGTIPAATWRKEQADNARLMMMNRQTPSPSDAAALLGQPGVGMPNFGLEAGKQMVAMSSQPPVGSGLPGRTPQVQAPPQQATPVTAQPQKEALNIAKNAMAMYPNLAQQARNGNIAARQQLLEIMNSLAGKK